MLRLTYEEKLRLTASLNWDYSDKPEDMLAVVEGRLQSSGALTRDRLFVRSMERLTWYSFVGLWGPEAITELYTPELAGRIWPKERRRHYDFAIGILRGEPVSPPGWGTEYYKSERYRFFSDRRHGAQPSLVPRP
jgi:hypothetical protein